MDNNLKQNNSNKSLISCSQFNKFIPQKPLPKLKVLINLVIKFLSFWSYLSVGILINHMSGSIGILINHLSGFIGILIK